MRNSLTGVVVVLVACLAAVAWAADTQPAPKTGTITSVDAAAKTFVLARDPILKAPPLTFTVDDKTTFTLDGKDSTFAAAVKADLAVKVTYTRNGDTRTATKVEADTQPAQTKIGGAPEVPTTAAKDVKVTVSHNDADHESATFKFKEVPSPAKTNAATKAKIEIVDGAQDPNGAGVEALNDGKLPSESDEPAANFFFNAGTEGGRLLIDLGSSISVKEVNTYSRHTDTRAPQVYTLYAADGAAAGFNAKPGKDVDPVKVGWTQIAKVDTRPKAGEPGGQYGVSISNAKGALGQFRYLLITASRTESDDGWGNTFFSEISVIDANEKAAPAEKAAAAASDTPAIKTLSIEGGKYTITINTTDTPDLTDWANKTLAPVVAEWYPKMIKMLPADGFNPPANVSITFKKSMDGIAYTTGHSVVGAEKYFKAHLDDVGAIVHELVHVVQQYHGRNNPGWLVEGVADYIRWFNYEPVNKRPRPNPAKAKYTDSYQVTGAFLDYVVKTHNKDLVAKLNVDMRNDKYSPDLWKTYTGKTVDELWDEYVATLKK